MLNSCAGGPQVCNTSATYHIVLAPCVEVNLLHGHTSWAESVQELTSHGAIACVLNLGQSGAQCVIDPTAGRVQQSIQVSSEPTELAACLLSRCKASL